MVASAPDGTVQLVGVVSWGLECAQINAPGVYTNIFKFIDFIKSVISPGNCKKGSNVRIATSTAENYTGGKTPGPATAINTGTTISSKKISSTESSVKK